MTNSSQKKRSLLRLCAAFFVITMALFFVMTVFIIVPKIDEIFTDQSRKESNITAKAYATQLKQYIQARKLALQDIASDTLNVNAILMGDGNNPALLDYIQQIKLLGENPHLIGIDAVGGILYSELSVEGNDYEWIEPILDMSVGHALRILDKDAVPYFELAVPVMYGARAEGVLVARFLADPSTLTGRRWRDDSHSRIIYSINGKSIKSDLIQREVAHKETILIPEFDMNLIYEVDKAVILRNRDLIVNNFLISIGLGAFLLFLVLFLIGRHIIIRPFKELMDLQDAISLAVEGISRVDGKGCYVALNASYAGTVGYTPEELIGEPWDATFYEQDLTKLNEAYQTMLKEGKATLEARGIKKDGTVFYKQISLVAQHDNSGGFLGHHCFLKDVTAKIITDKRIQQQQHDLQLIFDNVPVRIWYKDDKNNILRLNKKAAESMGGEVEDFEGKNTSEFFPEIAEKYLADDLKVIRSQKPLMNIIEEYIPANGERGWVSTDKIPYVNPENKEKYIFVCAQDITDLKNSEIEQSELVEELSFINRELEQFTFIASHDLKSPLRGIEQLASWIADDCSELLPAESQEHLRLMNRRVHRMVRLLDDLLTYAQAGRMELLNERINIKSLFVEMLDLRVQPFKFTYTLDVPSIEISIARKPMEIVIRNLLDNAVKHHDKDKGHIDIRYQCSGGMHIIDVWDDGPGIDPSMHEKAFMMFQTLKSRDIVEGSGIGLAIIKKILRRYNGDISLESHKGRGAKFKIEWPSDC